MRKAPMKLPYREVMNRSADPVFTVLRQAKRLAQEYRALTGKPLGITSEVAEYEAARLLELELMPARCTGYDAVERRGQRRRRLQIKGRCIHDPRKRGQRLGGIGKNKQFDAVLLVLLDADYNAVQIYEAKKAAVIAALEAPGSKARNESGALGVSKFKAIGKLRWPASNVSAFRKSEWNH